MFRDERVNSIVALEHYVHPYNIHTKLLSSKMYCFKLQIGPPKCEISSVAFSASWQKGLTE
jgi:hypothetical protein